MDRKQKRLLIIGCTAVVLIVLLFMGVSKIPSDQTTTTTAEAPAATDEATTASPAVTPSQQAPTNPIMPASEAQELAASNYNGKCAMVDGGLMYGNVVGLKKGANPNKEKSVHLRNAVSGEAMTFDVTAGACVFEKVK